MEQLLWYFLGGIVSFAIMFVFLFINTVSGTLRIDHSDPEIDVYRIDIDDLDKLSKKDWVILKVDNDADLSQK